MKIGARETVKIAKNDLPIDGGEGTCENIFDCPACGKKEATARQKWPLQSSMILQCAWCLSVFTFADDNRYPEATLIMINRGPGVAE